jgi:16S rRNA (cytosine1402-N4)-methyltransferase
MNNSKTNPQNDQESNRHIPVLLYEVNDYLLAQKKDTLANQKTNLFDGTLGGGGYTQHFINYCHENDIKLNQFSVDLDQKAIDRVLSYVECPDEINLELRNGNFADVIQTFDDSYFDGIVVDLGYSSNQLENEELGFSYLKADQELDLRYDTEIGNSCSYKLLHIHNWQQLGKILYNYSGEDLAAKIAKAIYNANKKTPWTVGEMVEIVISVIPAVAMKRKNQILSRVWQALRIWVNDEFASLETFVATSKSKLKVGGRLVVVSFHSLEDKIVTNYFRQLSKAVTEDVYGNKEFDFKIINARPITPTEKEISDNPRSRSAVMRVLERLR